MITQAEHSIAVSRWRSYFNEMNYDNFLDFVGRGRDLTPRDSGYTYSEEKERRFLLLNGPHWLTIIKAWEAKQGASHEPGDQQGRLL
jgi:hypothetical protein